MRRKSKFFRRFGFELEFSTPLLDAEKVVKSVISKIYGKNKFKTNDFTYSNANKYDKWELKYDGSTESELTTPISTTRNLNKIIQVIHELCKRKLKITANDSVHIHMQANDVPKHNIIAAWIQIERTILKCFPKHRRNNDYCGKLIHKKKYKKISDFFIDAENESNAHHAILSLNYYNQRKTVEFRVMEGNLKADEIVAWIKFCMLFLNYARTIDPVEIICDKQPKLTINDIIEMLKISNKEIVDFLIKREKRFK